MEKFYITKTNKKFLLNKEQKNSLKFLRSAGNNYNVTVIEGVTGSGKTIVYFERIKDFIDKGFQCLILLKVQGHQFQHLILLEVHFR